MVALILGKPDAILTHTKVIEKTIAVDPKTGRVLAQSDGLTIGYLTKRLGFKNNSFSHKFSAYLLTRWAIVSFCLGKVAEDETTCLFLFPSSFLFIHQTYLSQGDKLNDYITCPTSPTYPARLS